MLIMMLILMLILVLILRPGDSLVPPSSKLTLNLCAVALARMRRTSTEEDVRTGRIISTMRVNMSVSKIFSSTELLLQNQL